MMLKILITRAAWLTTAPVVALALISGGAAAANDTQLGIPGWTLSQAEAGDRAMRPYLRQNYVVPNVPDAAAERFRRAASMFTSPRPYPQISLLAYDYVTRCALAGEIVIGGKSTPLRWVRLPDAKNSYVAMTMAVDSLASMEALVKQASLADEPNCAGKVAQVYAADPARARGAEKLRDHVASMLDGGAIGSADAPLSRPALLSTMSGLLTARYEVSDLSILSTNTSSELTTVVLGAPGEQTRLAAQYRNLADGKWQFERLTVMGYGLARYVETKR